MWKRTCVPREEGPLPLDLYAELRKHRWDRRAAGSGSEDPQVNSKCGEHQEVRTRRAPASGHVNQYRQIGKENYIMEKKTEITRREFLKDTAFAGAGAAVLGGWRRRACWAPTTAFASACWEVGIAPATSWKCSRRFRASSLSPSAISMLPARATALEVAGPGAQAYTNYHEVLDRKDIDAVLIGSPDHWHKQMLIDAVNAGKDAYVEKPICHSIEEGVEMVRAVDGSERIVQTGTQQRNWAHWKLGKEIVASGRLGKVTIVHTYWYQKYKPMKAPPKIDLARLDWKSFLGDAPDQPFTEDEIPALALVLGFRRGHSHRPADPLD